MKSLLFLWELYTWGERDGLFCKICINFCEAWKENLWALISGLIPPGSKCTQMIKGLSPRRFLVLSKWSWSLVSSCQKGESLFLAFQSWKVPICPKRLEWNKVTDSTLSPVLPGVSGDALLLLSSSSIWTTDLSRRIRFWWMSLHGLCEILLPP